MYLQYRRVSRARNSHSTQSHRGHMSLKQCLLVSSFVVCAGCAGDPIPEGSTTSELISGSYPGDVGIENHPDVVFAEQFEEGSISSLTSRYNDVAHVAGMAFSSNVPPGSGGRQSLQMTSV